MPLHFRKNYKQEQPQPVQHASIVSKPDISRKSILKSTDNSQSSISQPLAIIGIIILLIVFLAIYFFMKKHGANAQTVYFY